MQKSLLFKMYLATISRQWDEAFVLLGALGQPRYTPAFSAMANGQIKGAGNAGKGVRIGYMKKFGVVRGCVVGNSEYQP